MKKILSILLTSSFLFAIDPPKAGTYIVDSAHSKVGFEIAHLVIATVDGNFATFEGQVEVGEKFEDMKVSATIQTASINTLNEKRDEHLRSPDFFDTANHPTMTFESTGIKGKPESFDLMGNLTIRGNTKPVTLKAKYLGTIQDPWGNTKAAFRAEGNINRKDFGLTWGKMMEAGPVVGDEVTLIIRVETALKK